MNSSSKPEEKGPAKAAPIRVVRSRRRDGESGAPAAAAASERRGPPLRLILFGLGLLIVVAVAVDLGRKGGVAPAVARRPVEDPAARVLGLNDRTYKDPAGRFEITVPAPWAVRDGADADPYTARFIGPGGMDLCVRLTPMDHDRLDLLEKEIRGIEFDRGLDTHIQPRFFNGRPVIERSLKLFAQELIMLDFMSGTTAHHIQAAAPRGTFERDSKLLWDILATYRVPTPPPAGDARKGEGGTPESEGIKKD